MIVIPAIDLRGGQCVRLFQGDFARETVYGADPIATARRWTAAGAPMLHLVDLDGARIGSPVQGALVRDIARAIEVPVQYGGGLRRLPDIEQALDHGIWRVVLGTSAIADRPLLVSALKRWGPERIVVGIDARDGFVATHGWLEATEVRATELARAVAGLGVTTVLYTDIARDGTLTSPNYAALAGIAECGVEVIASGGVAAYEHLTALAAIPGVGAAVVGQALYTGAVQLGVGHWDVATLSGRA